jgi:hypothetical protein
MPLYVVSFSSVYNNIDGWAHICKLLWSQGIVSEESKPPAYVAWQAGTTKRVFVPARQDGNQFLGTLKGLQIRALCAIVQKKAPPWFVAIARDTQFRDEEKSSGKANLFSIWTIRAMDRTSSQPQLKLLLFFARYFLELQPFWFRQEPKVTGQATGFKTGFYGV